MHEMGYVCTRNMASRREKVIPFLRRKQSLGRVLSVFNTFLSSTDLPLNTECARSIVSDSL